MNLPEDISPTLTQQPSHTRSESSPSRSGLTAGASPMRKATNLPPMRRSTSNRGASTLSSASVITPAPLHKSSLHPKRASSISVSSISSMRSTAGSTTAQSTPRKMMLPHSPPPTPPPLQTPKGPSVPFYISPFHRPSTNPRFTMSARDRDFADWADLRGDRMTVKIWGRVPSKSGWHPPTSSTDTKGKGKEPSGPPDDEPSWHILRTWDVNLNEMVPLPDDVSVLFCCCPFVLSSHVPPARQENMVLTSKYAPCDVNFRPDLLLTVYPRGL